MARAERQKQRLANQGAGDHASDVSDAEGDDVDAAAHSSESDVQAEDEDDLTVRPVAAAP